MRVKWGFVDEGKMGVCGERCFVVTAASEAPAMVLGCW